MCKWISKADYNFIENERLIVLFQYKEWLNPEVRAGTFFNQSGQHFLIDGYGWVADNYILAIIPFPTNLIYK